MSSCRLDDRHARFYTPIDIPPLKVSRAVDTLKLQHFGSAPRKPLAEMAQVPLEPGYLVLSKSSPLYMRESQTKPLLAIDEQSKLAQDLKEIWAEFGEQYRFRLTSQDSVKNFNYFFELIRRSLIYLFPEIMMNELRDAHLIKMLKWWEGGAVLNKQTCPHKMSQLTLKRKVLMYLKQIVAYFYLHERIPKPLLVGFKYRIRAKPRHTRPVQAESVKALFVATFDGTYQGLLMRAMLCLMLDCGLRRKDLCQLTRQDIDVGQQRVHVLVKGNKRGQLGFGEQSTQVLKGYLAERDKNFADQTSLFVTGRGSQMDRRNVNRMLARYEERAGLTKLTPHRFRSTCAVEHFRAGATPVEVQHILLHSTLDMAMQYMQLSEEEITAMRCAETSVVDSILPKMP